MTRRKWMKTYFSFDKSPMPHILPVNIVAERLTHFYPEILVWILSWIPNNYQAPNKVYIRSGNKASKDANFVVITRLFFFNTKSRQKEGKKRKRRMLTSSRTPLKFCPIITLPILMQKSHNSKRLPLDSILCFFCSTVFIFINKLSNKTSATTGMVFVPVSKIENTDAGCSELCTTCTIRCWLPTEKQSNICTYVGIIIIIITD